MDGGRSIGAALALTGCWGGDLVELSSLLVGCGIGVTLPETPHSLSIGSQPAPDARVPDLRGVAAVLYRPGPEAPSPEAILAACHRAGLRRVILAGSLEPDALAHAAETAFRAAADAGIHVDCLRLAPLHGRRLPEGIERIAGRIRRGLPVVCDAGAAPVRLLGLRNLAGAVKALMGVPGNGWRQFDLADAEPLSPRALVEALMRRERRRVLVLLRGRATAAPLPAIDARPLSAHTGWAPMRSAFLLGWPVAAPQRPGTCRAALDIAFALSVILVLSPLLAAIWLAIKLDSPGPGIYRQRRIGQDGRAFTCWKFRTMTQDTQTARTRSVDARRVTRVGRFLRPTKLDELPQVVNILRREMSVVGPRPPIEDYEDLIDERRRRGVLSMKPGITGLAQINGVDMGRGRLLARYDAVYMRRWRLGLDIWIVLRTALGAGRGDHVQPAGIAVATVEAAAAQVAQAATAPVPIPIRPEPVRDEARVLMRSNG